MKFLPLEYPQKRPSFTQRWVDRQGYHRVVTIEFEPEEHWEVVAFRCHQKCRAQGWEGHIGGKWNYIKSDVRQLFKTILFSPHHNTMRDR